MRHIICLAQSKWSADPERTQHFMRLLNDVEISYFELTVTANITKYLMDHNTLEAREPHPGIKVYRVPTILFWKNGATLPEKWSLKKTQKAIRRCLKEAGVRNGLLWCDTPVVADIIEQIPHSGLIYDCYRAWDRYPERMESQLAYDADLVFAASDNLLEHVSPCNQNTFLLANGVNYGLYARGGNPETMPDPAFDRFRGTVFGYFGNVERNMDLSPLLYAAKRNPDWTFVIIGRVKAGHPDASRIKQAKNIFCLGHRFPADVPGCLAACDVCIDLLHNDIADEDVVPERIYAYFAAQKPVACVYPRRYVPEYPDVIYGAQSDEEFERACLKAANELGRRKRIRRGQYARAADWGDRAHLLQQILRENGMI